MMLAAVSAAFCPITVLYFAFEFRELYRRYREQVHEEAKKGPWPLAISKDPEPTPGIRFRDRTPEEAPVCPVCHEEVYGQVRVCEKCGTAHHEDCWNFQGGCAQFGCG